MRTGCRPPLGAFAAAAALPDARGAGRSGRWCRAGRRPRSADAPLVGAPLLAHPPSRIVVPGMPAVRNRAESRLDQLPTMLVLECARDRARDERAAPPGTDTPVELANQSVLECNVQTHGHKLTHTRSWTPGPVGSNGRALRTPAPASMMAR